MFERLLIANRGEIACRIARTARRLGVRTIAVFSDPDQCALHVELSDEAWRIGPGSARESYLAIDKIIDVAQRSGAQAVHPGYGFLAENPDFAGACEQKGMVFIGPSAEAMRLMGSKASAKTVMERAGVPTVPGYHGELLDVGAFSEAARRIGYPVLIKASAGGGGRGMRVVSRPEELGPAMEAAEREALASFGDGRLLLEKYLASPRHIEIQIFGDSYGGAISFLERDCSVQRRHQKILEETPAPGLSSSLRQGMRDAAIAAARAVGYVGAGTVEFLVEEDQFYFLEMNTRLQVEHPITEMISAQDLVEWQLRIASGEKLPVTQSELVMRGCAMEARICAENPREGFLPSVGQIKHLHYPQLQAAVRVDTGVVQGDRITEFYDSLIAKLVVWGEDRAQALQLLRKALNEIELVGVQTNLDLLRAIADDHRFTAGGVDTGFVERNAHELLSNRALTEPNEFIVLAAASFIHLHERRQNMRAAGKRCSPWSLADGWRIHGNARHEVVFDLAGRKRTVRLAPLSDGGFQLDAFSASHMVRGAQKNGRLYLHIDDVKRDVGGLRDGNAIVIILDGRNYALTEVDPLQPPRNETGSRRQMSAPIPARVTGLLVQSGERVKIGAPLLTLEAMKMEITLRAPHDATVTEIRCNVGQMAPEGAELIVLAEDDS